MTYTSTVLYKGGTPTVAYTPGEGTPIVLYRGGYPYSDLYPYSNVGYSLQYCIGEDTPTVTYTSTVLYKGDTPIVLYRGGYPYSDLHPYSTV